MMELCEKVSWSKSRGYRMCWVKFLKLDDPIDGWFKIQYGLWIDIQGNILVGVNGQLYEIDSALTTDFSYFTFGLLPPIF